MSTTTQTLEPATYTTNLLHRTTTIHTTYDQALSSFAPELLKHILARTEQAQIKPPFVKTFEAVALFADVSGFTKATESLSNAMGDLGTEILAHKINSYLPHIAKKIVGSGGDVVKFAGDALLCIWPPPADSIYNEYEVEFKRLERRWRRYQDLTDTERLKHASLCSEFEAIRRQYMVRKYSNEKLQRSIMNKNVFAAIQCAIEIQDQFGSMDLSGSYYDKYPAKKKRKKKRKKKEDNKIEFRVKIGIGFGKIHLLIVGGNLGRCEYLICGDGLIQAFDCENDCSTEEDRMIIISEVVAKNQGISDHFLLKKVGEINNFEICGINRKNKKRHKIDRKQYGHLIPDISNGLASKLARYIPAAVKPHLNMPQQIWTGELREVTILFVSLPWNARSFLKFTERILHELQDIIYTLQSVIYKYQGSLNKFLIDDKGSTVMCVFGLPPVAHENDASRAVLAALELRERVGRKEQPAAIGVSCGTVFVGIIGSKGVRREYGILGDKVNLSARLMALSRKNPVKLGEVIVDESVYCRAAKEIRIEWSDLQCIWVKGKCDKVHIWRPARNNIAISAHKIGQASYLETSDKISLSLIEKEIQIFKQKGHTKGKVILIEGEVGIGKSSLLGQIQVRNSTFIWFLWGKANAFNECMDMMHTPYIVWKQILLGFCSRYSLITSKNRYLFSLYVKERRSDLYPYLYLISSLIDLGNESLLDKHYKKRKGKVDSNKLHDIIFCLLEWSARIKPIAIIIDEMQYLTKKDWKITRRLCALVNCGIIRNILVFLGSTPIDNQRYRPLFSDSQLIDNFRDIRLSYTDCVISPSSWGLNKTKFFIKKYFDIGDVSSRLVATVHSQCGGRPGFCEHFLSELEAPKNKGEYIAIFDILHRNQQENRDTFHHHSDRNQMYAAFHLEIDNRFKIGLDVTFPVPSYIMSITLAHCDKLNAEQAFILKIASVICKSKGNNSIQFEEHMIRGCHPLPDTKMNAKRRLRNALSQLCVMQFIYCVNKERTRKMTLHDNIDTNINGYNHTHKPSYNNFDNIPSVFDSDHVDLTDFDGITDPMPATKALLQEPSKSVPYKRGKMFKRGVNFINMTETSRTFVFKHRTLYWIKDEENEEYPRSRIKFDESVLKLKREDQRSCSIKTPRKEYILRCQKKKDMDQWCKLFTEALEANWLSHSMMKRMKNHQNNNQNKKKFDLTNININNNNFNNKTKKKTVKFAIQDDDDAYDDDDEDFLPQEDVVNVLKRQLSQSNHNVQTSSSSSYKEIDPQLIPADDDDDCNVIGPKPGDVMYEFAYGFLRDIVYEQMLHNQRKQLHTNALKYIAKCLERKNDDKLALLHTRHVECVQRYSDMLQGDDHQKTAFQPKRQSFFAKRAR